MGKVDSFLIMIVFILCTVFATYKNAEYQFSGVEFERQKNEKLIKYVQKLKLQQKVAELERLDKSNVVANKRTIASLPVTHSKIKIQPSMTSLQTNEELRSNDQLAKGFYDKAVINCEKLKKEDVCTKNIEIVISQFPETRWAGESLILLSRLYIKTRHTQRAREVMKVVAREFKHDKEIQAKLAELERSKL